MEIITVKAHLPSWATIAINANIYSIWNNLHIFEENSYISRSAAAWCKIRNIIYRAIWDCLNDEVWSYATNLYGNPLMRKTPVYPISEAPENPGVLVLIMLALTTPLAFPRPTMRNAPYLKFIWLGPKNRRLIITQTKHYQKPIWFMNRKFTCISDGWPLKTSIYRLPICCLKMKTSTYYPYLTMRVF